MCQEIFVAGAYRCRWRNDIPPGRC